ncbi:hypothetical protein ACS15_3600 [Ralstonia insidiosa]|uniref:Uncharacterized protein n=1 Tax=Ralstonia insidiosa TaxID=190721 RepID=A0AAC9BDJ7_9RALS|nr:hypothetical protein ACS15_3600 [Ralstonia insidiosa]
MDNFVEKSPATPGKADESAVFLACTISARTPFPQKNQTLMR